MSFQPRPWTAAEEDEAVRLYATGLSASRVGLALRRDNHQTRIVLRKRGVLRAASVRRLYEVNAAFFAYATDLSAYWAGFIAADGSVRRGDVRIAIKSDDRDHLERFAADIGYTGVIRELVRPARAIAGREVSKPTVLAEVCVWCPRMVCDLTAFGVVPDKSHCLLPWNGPANLMRHYWRGLLDGDGSWGFTNHGRYAFCNLCGTEPVVRAFEGYVRRHTGYSFRIWPNRGAFIGNVQSSHAVQSLARVLYEGDPVSMPRKRRTVEAILARSWRAT